MESKRRVVRRGGQLQHDLGVAALGVIEGHWAPGIMKKKSRKTSSMSLIVYVYCLEVPSASSKFQRL